MRGLVYEDARKVAVKTVDDPRIEQPQDAIVRITTTNICGSDLHMYEGRTDVAQGTVLGHENMGIVQEVGPAVDRIRVGDRVSVPFNIACGTCRNCNAGWTSFCLRTNPTDGVDGAAYGYANMGPYRGGQAEIDAVPIDYSAGDPVEQILEATHGAGADRGIECVGYQAHDHEGHEEPTLVLDNLVRAVRTTGGIGVVGVYVPQDPGAATDGAAQGRIGWDYGTFFSKGQRMGTGQAPVKRYNRQLRDLITEGRAKPGWIVSHELPLEEAPDASDKFDQRIDGYTKVLLHPDGGTPS